MLTEDALKKALVATRRQNLRNASAMGDRLYSIFGAYDFDGNRDDMNGQVIPAEAVQPVTEIIVDFAAALLQEWLDAGSERDVTIEELGETVHNHVKSWSTADPHYPTGQINGHVAPS